MPNLTIETERLELIAATVESLEVETDLPRLRALLHVDVPENWPMPLYDDDARQQFLSVLNADPAAAGWTSWYIIVPDGAGRKTLIGSVGAGGPPDESGAIMIGYSLLDQFHGKGYATEALQGFLAWAGRHPGLRRVIADTYPHLKASIRVLEKCGFVQVEAGPEEGTIRFELWCR